MTDLGPVLSHIAADLDVPVDVLDAFVFRRVDGGRMVHLGGGGRAFGWAGVVDVDVDAEPLLREAWIRGGLARHQAGAARHIFGPYWAETAIVVPLPPDHLVVFGNVERLDAPDDTLTALAQMLVERIAEVSPTKRLADELEVLHAVRRVALSAGNHVADTAERIASAAADALSCELALLWVPEAKALAVAGTTAGLVTSAKDHGALSELMMQLFADRRALPRCEQDNSARPLPSPLGVDSAVTSWYAIPLAGPPDGLLLMCHTRAEPRGFTLLCQRIGRHIADAAATPLATALAHERLQTELAQASSEARRDPLTDLPNRRAWAETITELADDRRHHDVAIVMLDVDNLKHINDAHGHREGDAALRAVARAFTASLRGGDVAARLGGDEFAAALTDIDERACVNIVERIRSAIAELPPIGACQTSASIGWSIVTADDSIEDGLRVADEQMYVAKQRARQSLPSTASQPD